MSHVCTQLLDVQTTQTLTWLFYLTVSYSPIAWGITSMSENIIAASRENLRIGCNVTSHATSGFWHISKNVCFFLVSINSGK